MTDREFNVLLSKRMKEHGIDFKTFRERMDDDYRQYQSQQEETEFERHHVEDLLEHIRDGGTL